MSCNLIEIKGGKKVARPITNPDEYRSIRSTSIQQGNLRMARSGVKNAKMKLVQFNYSGHYPNGVVKGNKLPSKAFGFDIDDAEEFKRVSELLLKEPEKYGLLMLERSVNQGGHAVFKRQMGRTILENQVRIAMELDCEMDTNAHDINRVYFTTSADADDLLFLSDELFTDEYKEDEVAKEAVALEDRERYGEEELPEGAHGGIKHYNPNKPVDIPSKPLCEALPKQASPSTESVAETTADGTLCYLGIPYSDIITKWWNMYNGGQAPVQSNRDVLTYELAVNLRHICGFDRELLRQVIPCYDGFPEEQKMKCIDSALCERRTQMPKRLKDVLLAIQKDNIYDKNIVDALDELNFQDELFYTSRLPQMPQGVSDSIDAAGQPLALATMIAIAPAIGTLATGVRLDVHGTARGLNVISYICGEFGSGKGQMDPIIEAWMRELQNETDLYTQEEEQWAQSTRRMKSGKAPEQPKFPVRMLPLNNTLANLAERLGNAEGKHSFSFTPEADTVAQKWKSSISDFSVMLRQAYDEARFDREAKSADAVRVHIKNLRWNVTMCGTQDALYRVITNYTDGLLSRIAIARTPDNTFAKLDDNPAHITEEQKNRISQIAHLLPFMNGEVVLDKLEQRGREWLERIRLEAIKSDDRVLARQRLRGCVNAQRITCALWLPAVAESLINKHGVYGAESLLKKTPWAWQDELINLQNDDMMTLFDIVADYLLDNDLYFFRSKIEQAYDSKVAKAGERVLRGKNDTIYNRLDDEFTFEQAMQSSIAIKGVNVTKNTVQQMLKNWKNQGLIVPRRNGHYVKIS